MTFPRQTMLYGQLIVGQVPESLQVDTPWDQHEGYELASPVRSTSWLDCEEQTSNTVMSVIKAVYVAEDENSPPDGTTNHEEDRSSKPGSKPHDTPLHHPSAITTQDKEDVRQQ